MSHFTQVRTKLTNRNCLVQALEDLKLQPQVHETPQPLTGYYGDSQGQSAEIIISGRTIQKRADVGFKLENGVYALICDDYELIRSTIGDKVTFYNQLLQAYGKRMVLAKAEELREKFGECSIEETTKGSVQTMRLTFAGHQEVKQYARR